jgi:hypothetical protein
MEDKQVPNIVVGRLPIYLRALSFLKADNREITSSQELGDRLGISSAQIRKDLSHFGEFGKQGTGYEIRFLENNLKEILHVDRMWDVVLVGAGDLGNALASYKGFADRGFRVAAAFDSAPHKINTQLPGGLVIQDVIQPGRAGPGGWLEAGHHRGAGRGGPRRGQLADQRRRHGAAELCPHLPDHTFHRARRADRSRGAFAAPHLLSWLTRRKRQPLWPFCAGRSHRRKPATASRRCVPRGCCSI